MALEQPSMFDVVGFEKVPSIIPLPLVLQVSWSSSIKDYIQSYIMVSFLFLYWMPGFNNIPKELINKIFWRRKMLDIKFTKHLLSVSLVHCSVFKLSLTKNRQILNTEPVLHFRYSFTFLFLFYRYDWRLCNLYTQDKGSVTISSKTGQ